MAAPRGSLILRRKPSARFAAAHPGIKSIRVITFEGLLLEASTAPADTGIKAAPRQLERDEKPLYDLGQKLRAAVSENRENAAQGQSPIGEEMSIERMPDGSLVLSGPVEHPAAANTAGTGEGPEVVGMVQIHTAAPPVTNPCRIPGLHGISSGSRLWRPMRRAEFLRARRSRPAGWPPSAASSRPAAG